MNFEDLKNKLNDVDCVSFDVFDTAILRPFMDPKDLFDYIGEMNDISDFRKKRVTAEKDCRKSRKREITLDEIYSCLDEDLLFMKEKEIATEIRLSLANPEIMKIYRNVLQSGKRIVFISDMYLPAGVLDSMLRKNGYDDYTLYVSSEYDLCKYDGSMYQYVLKDLDIEAKRLLHIGDNLHSDLKIPQRMGIKAIRYILPREQYFSSHHREHRCYRRNRSLGSSVIIAMDMLKWLKKEHEEDYWYNVGYRFGGPVSSFFVNNMMSVMTESTDMIFFISRDGYNLERIYKILCSDPIEERYVYSSRFFSVIFGNIIDDSSYARIIFDHFQDDSNIVALCPEKDSSNNKYIKAFNENKDIFIPLLNEEREKFIRYVRRMAGDASNILVVDATTMKYSSQRLLQGALDNDVKTIGYYYHTMAKSDLEYIAYRDCSHNFFNWTYVNIVEFLLSSPEYPIRDISDDGLPIYMDNVSEDEIHRVKIYDDVTRGEEDYANDLKRIFGDDIPELSSGTVTEWLRVLVDLSRRTGDEFSKMRWAADAEHYVYHGLIFRPSDLIFVIKVNIGEKFWKIKNKG